MVFATIYEMTKVVVQTLYPSPLAVLLHSL